MPAGKRRGHPSSPIAARGPPPCPPARRSAWPPPYRASHRAWSQPGTVGVNSPIQVTTPTVDLHIGLVAVPPTPSLAPPRRTQTLCEQRSELSLPLPHGLVRDSETSYQEDLGQVAQA